MALTVLTLAIAIGASLRFYRLGTKCLSGDEGATWAAASAPTLDQVVRLQRRLDPGKLAVHDLVMHEWMGLFGAKEAALRGFSAGMGTICIALVFLVMVELYRSFSEAPEFETGYTAGAFAALIFATNVTIVDAARTARMYPLMMAALLLHVLFFVRSQRTGAWSDYSFAAGFLGLAIATNFTAAFMLVSEGLWLAYLGLSRAVKLPGRKLHVWGPALALLAGLALLSPFAKKAVKNSAWAVKSGFLHRIKPDLQFWPYEALQRAVQNETLLWLFALMAVWAIWRSWSSKKLVLLFLFAWLTGPFLAVMAITRLITPLTVLRYEMSAFVALFGLAAVGAASLRSALGRVLAVVLILSLGTQALGGYFSAIRGVDWRNAAEIAAAQTGANSPIAIAPAYAADVTRYYLPRERRTNQVFIGYFNVMRQDDRRHSGGIGAIRIGPDDSIVPAPACAADWMRDPPSSAKLSGSGGADSRGSGVRVLILAPRGNDIPPRMVAALQRCFPTAVARFQNVEVRISTGQPPR